MSQRFSDPSRVVTCSLCGSKQRLTTIRAHYRKCFAATATPSGDNPVSASYVCASDGLTDAEHGPGIDEDSPGHGPWYTAEQWAAFPKSQPPSGDTKP